jgi:hypothetical protein
MTFGHSKTRFAIGLAWLALAVRPASGQMVTVHPTPPPCAGTHCLRQIPGATVTHHGAASAARAACPQGTIYDSRKGTCRVVPD